MRFVIACAALLIVTGTAAADPPRAGFRIDRDQAHVGVPFGLHLIVEGFEESPAPALPKLEIADAEVTPVGAEPNVTQSVQIVNGRRSAFVRVTWVLTWQVVVTKAGRITVPTTSVSQGTAKATANGIAVGVSAVPAADDMKLSLELPKRPVVVGETFPVTLTWLFKRQPSNPTFQLPMLDGDVFSATTGATPTSGRVLALPAGGKELKLPYEIDQVDVNGERFNRLQLTFNVTPRKAGTLDIAPTTILAPLAVGRANVFGESPTRMFRVSDVPRTLEVKALPEKDRPPTFAGAVGDQYAISVRTSRSVVSLGEPVELDVTVKSNQSLDALSLGKLDGEGRLPKDKFTVPSDPPTGELADEGKTKTFKVVAQVTGPATEIPALAFSYFDPAKGAYQTIYSEPIALSVKGGTFVGASDVVSGAPTKRGPSPAQPVDDTSLVNADLALSTLAAAQDRPFGGPILWLLVGLLYAVPLAFLGFRTWQLRTRGHREEAAEIKTARVRLERLLAEAASAPAREVAGPLGAALRELARVVGASADDGGVLAKLETESFAPTAASRPIDAQLREQVTEVLRRWTRSQRSRRVGAARDATTTALIVLVVLGFATDTYADGLDAGRRAYQDAMAMTSDPSARKAAFARAAEALGEATRATPGRPELLADWGNAALGAGDVATATIAYLRALALDPDNQRARRNLALLRARHADAFRPRSEATATDALLFFHAWPRSSKLVVGSIAFAIAVLLVVPWRGRRRRTLTGLALLPCTVWIAMLVSIATARTATDAGVIVEDVVMRAADSAGAPATLSQAIPRGSEVVVLEQRDRWTRVRIASGTTGWIPGAAVTRVVE